MSHDCDRVGTCAPDSGGLLRGQPATAEAATDDRPAAGWGDRPPTFTVIVPAHQVDEAFRQCLAGLARLNPPPLEVIVAVDGGDAACLDLARGHGFEALATPEHVGPARARNLAARRARGDILLFTDADVTVPPHILRQFQEVFHAGADLTAVIGSYDDQPAAGNFLSQYKNLLHHYVHQHSSDRACTFWGACGAIRRQAFLAAGGFDESYRQPCAEDIELGYRLVQAGCRIRLCKSIQVKHWKVWRAGLLVRTDFFARALPWTELILRFRRLPNDLNLRIADRWSVLMVCALLASMVGAWWWRPMGAGAGAAAVALLAIHAPLYRFFLRKRGPAFMLATIPWHWFQYLYGGVAFVLGIARHCLRAEKRPALAPATRPGDGKPGGAP